MLYNFENPPVAAAVPSGAEDIAFGTLATILIVTMLLAWRRAGREEKGVVLLCILGGAMGVVFDAQFSVLTLRWFPRIDSAVLYMSSGRVVPFYWLLMQATFVGAAVAWQITGSSANPAIQRDAWKPVWLLALLRLLVEMGGIHLGLWSYYGWQPFSVCGVPLWMPILSAVAVVATARFVQFSLTTHHPVTLLIGVPLSYSTASAMLVWPMALALNHRDSNVVWAAIAMLATLLLAGLMVEALRRLPRAPSYPS